MGLRQSSSRRAPKALLVVDGDEVYEVPGFPVERVVDPVGAGDAFAAGFLAGLLEGQSIVEAVRLANACGASATTVPGDIEGMPERAEIDRLPRVRERPGCPPVTGEVASRDRTSRKW